MTSVYPEPPREAGDAVMGGEAATLVAPDVAAMAARDRHAPGPPVRRATGARAALYCCGAALAVGCAPPLPPAAFAATTPAFDPVAFWTGHTSSWGVIENRDGAPTAIITTTTDATPEGAGGLHMVQHVVHDGQDSVRDWHIRRLGGGRFEATANDLVGVARGATSGRTLHWTWTLATKPGNCLFDVTMDQWMYLADDGTLMNRTIITKLGVRLAEVSEQFVRRGPSDAKPAATPGPLTRSAGDGNGMGCP